MKKLVVQINSHRFELESNGQTQDNVIQGVVRELNARIEKLRHEHGFPDNARATALLALLLALEKSNSTGAEGAAKAEMDAESAKIIQVLAQQVEDTLARTDGSPAKALAQ